jgi:diguanylate cyclase (GGDEF)-like protein
MTLDIDTLFRVTVYVEAILGLLLLFAWVQNITIRAVCCWGFAHLIRAGSVMLFGTYGEMPDLISIDLANVFLFTSFAITWAGARMFDQRPVDPVYVVAGGVLWLTICRLPLLQDWIEMRALIACAIIAGYSWLTAYAFWEGRSEQLVSRWPAILMLFAQGALYLLRTPMISLLPKNVVASSDMFKSVWLTVISFEGLLFTISVAFILLAMAKERTELRHRTAAMLDPLTGIANRRAFLQDAAALSERYRSNAKPVTVLLMDLDHFKSINDRFGHAVGDRVLEAFAKATRKVLRDSDLFGRLGGEEFAAILHAADRDEGLALAHGIRESFSKFGRVVDGHAIGATVSIGVSHCEGPAMDVSSLLAQADRALYLAKENGRNRIEVASLESYLARAHATPAVDRAAAQSAA